MNFVKRTWTEIDMDRAIHNFKTIKKASQGKKVCCVVKADAYGHGAVELAVMYEQLGADFLAVSNMDEGKELRKYGISLPILILGYTPSVCAKELAENNFSQAVYGTKYAQKLSEQCVKYGVECKIHLKIDTGMSRIGFMCQSFPRDEKSIEEAYQAATLPNLVTEGIFTHFAVSDEREEGKEFTLKQYDNFVHTVKSLEDRGINFEIRHCANSGAIEDYPMFDMDMVRAGIILYGLSPSSKLKDALDIKPVMKLVTCISYVKEIEAGATVSYGRTFTADKKMKIATVPIGYADGYIRKYGEEGYMLVNGKKAKIIGRICMDQTMLDVSGIEDVNIGDKVIVFGDGSKGEPTADDLARWSETINYEVICIIGKRVPRLFVKDGKITDVMYKL